MIPSVFRQKIEDKQTNYQANNPGSMVGFLVDTSSVISREAAENPYFLPLNGLSMAEMDIILNGGDASNLENYPRLKALGDSIKNGFSVLNKPPGSVREVKTYINPNALGHVTGGLGNKPAGIEAGKEYLVEMVNTGKNTTPTVVGLTLATKEPQGAFSGEEPRSSTPSSETPATQPLQGSINGEVRPLNPYGSNMAVKPIKTIKENFKPAIDNKSAYPSIIYSNPDLELGTDYLGNPIRTGTTYIPKTILMELIDSR